VGADEHPSLIQRRIRDVGQGLGRRNGYPSQNLIVAIKVVFRAQSGGRRTMVERAPGPFRQAVAQRAGGAFSRMSPALHARAWPFFVFLPLGGHI